MASDNVFAFKDCIPPGEPDPDLVELLSYLLCLLYTSDAADE